MTAELIERPKAKGILYYNDVAQHTDEWLALRCGLLTASELKNIITPVKLEYASNDQERTHLYELAGQRITGYVEPSYLGPDMERGMEEEGEARALYMQKYAPVLMTGFMTNDKWGFTLGFSPDGLVGDDGIIEIKSRRNKFQIQTIIKDLMPVEHRIQVQAGLLVSGRKWCDFISYSGGLHLYVKRIHADEEVQTAIIAAAGQFYTKLDETIAAYHATVKASGLIPTPRKIEEEMIYG